MLVHIRARNIHASFSWIVDYDEMRQGVNVTSIAANNEKTVYRESTREARDKFNFY